jgi:hypothetical protein
VPFIQDRIIDVEDLRLLAEQEAEEEEDEDDEAEEGEGWDDEGLYHERRHRKKSLREMQEEKDVPQEEGEDEIRVKKKYDDLVRQFVAVNTAKQNQHVNVDEIPDFNTSSLRYFIYVFILFMLSSLIHSKQ